MSADAARGAGPGGSGLRFAVIGNCQGAGFRDCLLAYLPKAEAVLFDLTALGAPPASIAAAEAIAAQLDGFTHVFAHAVYGDRFGPLDHARLALREPKVHFLPNIAFKGFHPDCEYLSAGGRPLLGPLNVYHSALAATAFTLGLPAARTARLFNALVMRKLGYLDEHAIAVAGLARHFADFGYDLAALLPAWSTDRAFMYTTNHPRLLPIADLARMALRRAGLGGFRIEDTELVVDRLAEHPVFPVYPPIARRLGIAGHLRFRGLAYRDRPIAVLELDRFIEQSFARYAEQPEAVAEAVADNPRTQHILRILPALLDTAG